MLSKQTITDLPASDIAGKCVLIRVDLNVPLKNGVITDETRIRASIPTLKYLIDNNAKLIIASHLGRPNGEVKPELSLAPVAKSLTKHLGINVLQAPDCIGAEVESMVSNLNNGDALLLENVRFHKEEEENDPGFVKKLANLADMFIFDAFGTAHRQHATTAGISALLPAYAGFLVQKELEFLDHSVNNPKQPFVAIIGGAKVSSKIGVLKHLLEKVDALVIGGAMVFTFLKAKGINIGKSLCEDSKIPEAVQLLERAKALGANIIFPVDQVVTADLGDDTSFAVVDINAIPDNMMGVDIGPKSIKEITESVKGAGTVLWNGPLGIFEIPRFAEGTFAVAKALASSHATTIIGGGDSAAAIAKAGLSDSISHISTGGGASLKFLEGTELPGVAALKDK